MSKDRYVEERARFAEDIGRPDLFAIIDQFPLYAGTLTLARTIAICDLFRSTLEVPGDIVEFGCWEGANLLFLAKLLSVFSPGSPKKVYGFDSFEGLQTFSDEDQLRDGARVALAGKYKGVRSTIDRIIELHALRDVVTLVIGDACVTVPEFFDARPGALVSFAFCDFDLYRPTIIALNTLHSAMSAGGLIVLDQANCGAWAGEDRALEEFLGVYSDAYTREAIPHTRQPTVALRRLRCDSASRD
jgi:SAM-dependent methyltransferase